MVLLKPDEIRKMSKEERQKKLQELRLELLKLRVTLSMGGAIENPARIREIRKAIARILTIEREEQLKEERKRSEQGKRGK